jgi:hypothetical protein
MRGIGLVCGFGVIAMRSDVFCIGVSILGMVSAASSAEPPWRVVVQDSTLRWLSSNTPGSLLAATAGASGNILHLVDARGPRILLTWPFPYRILSVAVSGGGDLAFVSTSRSISRVSIEDGSVAEILPDVSGTLAIDDRLKLLGILGRFPRDDPDPPTLGSPVRPFSPLTLGVYDLATRRWRRRVATPIEEIGSLGFDGDQLVAYGEGGDVHSRGRNRTFPCVVRLDVRTGEVATEKGEIRRVGDALPAQPSIPEALARSRAAFLEAVRKVDPAAARMGGLTSRLPPTAFWGDHDSPHLAGLDSAREVRFVVRRSEMAAVVSIGRDGDIEIGPMSRIDSNPERNLGGRLIATGYGSPVSITDLLTGVSLGHLPQSLPALDPWPHAIEGGYLVYREGRLSLFKPGLAEPVLFREPADDRFDDLKSSRLRSTPGVDLLGVVMPGGRSMAVYRPSAGEEIGSVPCPEATPIGYNWPVGFNGTGTMLAVRLTSSPQVCLYEVSAAGLAAERPPIPSFGFYLYLPLEKGWLATGGNSCRILDADGQYGREFPVGDVRRARTFRSPWGDRILLETGMVEGTSHLYDMATGRALGRWPSAGSLPAFEGRLLVRSLQWAGAIELVSPKNLETVATIHPVVVGRGLGWVAFTPDGYWDASPGAEGFAEVFRGTELADSQARSTRHDRAKIRERLSSTSRAMN